MTRPEGKIQGQRRYHSGGRGDGRGGGETRVARYSVTFVNYAIVTSTIICRRVK